MTKRMQKTVAAFTLIEIVVVVAIIGIASTVAIVSMSSGRAERAVETEARGFAALVREAQNDALSGKQITPGTVPCQFQLVWSGGSYSFIYRYANLGVACTAPAPLNSSVTYTLKNGVTFVSPSSLYFSVPHADSDIPSSDYKKVIFSKSGKNHVVCVYPNGSVIDQKGSGCP